jgi:protoheme IX farnesyltransferase
VGALLGLLFFQFLLGASVIWSKRSVIITVVHLVIGALCLATSVGFTTVLFRDKSKALFQKPFDAKAYLELTKPGICVMALIMAAVGFFIGSFTMNWVLFFTSLLGIGLVGASCGTLNQYLEHELDSKMPRTANRPIPTGKITTQMALVLGIVLAIVGETILFLGVNTLTGALGILTLVGYLGVYTPSKRWNSLSTLLGAIPGAMPPLLGYTSACGEIDMVGILLFAILFLWQIPHFLAIGWMYRDDYSKASFPILTVVDASGRVTVQQAILYTLILLPITLLPSAWGVVGHLYSVGAAALGIYFLYQAVLLGIRKDRMQARRLFFTSLIYLPALGLLFASDKWIFG